MNKYRIIGILSSLVLIILSFKMCSNKEKIWVEIIKLSEDVSITDTAKYNLDNAVLFTDKKEVKIVLQEIVDEFNEMIGESDEINSEEIYLLNHLDSTSDIFILDSDGSFQTELDTISIGLFKCINRIETIKDEDWEKDTIRILRDFNDKRNFYFNSLHRVASELISRNKVKIIDKKFDNEIHDILLKHHSWGINSYQSYFEFQDGRYIIGKDLVLGL